MVVFPGLLFPVYVSRQSNIAAVEYALKHGKQVALSVQAEGPPDQDPSEKNLKRIGTIAFITHSVRLANGDLRIRLHVQGRLAIDSFLQFTPFIKVKIRYQDDPTVVELRSTDEALIEKVKQSFAVLAGYDEAIAEGALTIEELAEPGALADFVSTHLPIEVQEAQQLLEVFHPIQRLRMVEKLLTTRLDALMIRERISTQAQAEVGKSQHEVLLREQMRQIQEELGETPGYEDELRDVKKHLTKLKVPAPARKEAERQLKRLQMLHPESSEAALARTYLDWILDLPWSKRTTDRLDLERAKQILDRDHFGLEKTKERILDFLGVSKLRERLRGPILILVGPPGVGKTSLGRSIANALGRKFVRISLGGLRDEAEIRGHRRTYVGALPGRIIQALKTAGTKNPVIMLDEIDKIGSDFRGDPASVLLEVLDPEQNRNFEDHYLNVPFDLSEVMFIGTANITDTIPDVLLDRMEVIEISGYTTEEKLQIASRYLIPQEFRENGLDTFEVSLPDSAVLKIIQSYTEESGVRELRRNIGSVFRKLARLAAEGKKPPRRINPNSVTKLLGPPKYFPDKRHASHEQGVVTGLAWTAAGGRLLTIEVSVTKGKGTLSLTGQMGEVMRESAMAALTYVLSNAPHLGVDAGFYEQSNVHVHVPQGAIPKDGPSAGIAVAVALVSLLTKTPVSRDVAMTGEITLRGHVLRIGGLKEKALAARRAGISVVIIPKENEGELSEFPKYIRDTVSFVSVSTIEEALQVALLPEQRIPRKRPTVLRI